MIVVTTQLDIQAEDCIWSSSKTLIAIVDSNSIITELKEGTVNITITYNKKKIKLRVNVKE